MECQTRDTGVRVAHQGLIAIVDGLAANTVVQGGREIEALIAQSGTDTTIEVWVWRATIEVTGIGE